LLRSHGQERKYYHTVVGLNYRTTDIQSAIGLVQLERLPDAVRRRRHNAHRLTEVLSSVAGIRTPHELGGSEHSFHQYTVVVERSRDGLIRDRLAADLNAVGIETAVHYPRPLHHQPALAGGEPTRPLPVAEALCESVLSLPVHPGVTDPDIDRIGDALRERVAARPG
jgi:perosamine synthetase